MKFPDARLLVFAKAPIPGRVKTRLTPELTDAEATELHIKLVRHTLETACADQLCPVELWCAPSTEHSFFKQCQEEFGVSLHQQKGEDIGSRMEHALNSALKGATSAVLIGTDCPERTVTDLQDAFEQLSLNDDIVLGPAEDGGYVLIGAQRTHSTLFSQIDWGTDRVMETTRQRLRALNWRWKELRTFWDLDRPEDLHRYNELQTN